MEPTRRYPMWVEHCSDEDLAFVRRLVLASGSLKEVAGQYDVSYPTIRGRLDRLIEKLKVIEQFEHQSPMERALRVAYAEGRMDLETLKGLLTVAKNGVEGK
jgi:hypothetical protein